MKIFSDLLRPALVFTAVWTVLFGAFYPGVSTVLVQVLFPSKAAGSLITKDDKVLGSELIGQHFTRAEYFWGRPSATAPTAYNAGASAGSNLGTNNPALVDAVRARIAALRDADPGNSKPIPIDLVTASGSGLDPHISPAAAEYQLPRVARARGLPEAKLRTLVKRYTDKRQFGVLGEPGVNVLKLNLALDGKL